MVRRLSHLLVLGCSQRKRTDPGFLPAIERYDGVNFRVLKKASREGHWPEGLRVLILSAEYGLIEADERIATYDRKMTLSRAIELQDRVGSNLDRVLLEATWSSILINLGRSYLPAIHTSTQLKRSQARVAYLEGGIGERLAALKHWLVSAQDYSN